MSQFIQAFEHLTDFIMLNHIALNRVKIIIEFANFNEKLKFETILGKVADEWGPYPNVKATVEAGSLFGLPFETALKDD